MNKLKMMTPARFNACRIIAMRIQNGDGNVAAAVTDATQRLIHMGMHAGMAAEIARDATHKLSAGTPQAEYERLLAIHDWTYAYSDCSRTYRAGCAERGRLNMMAAHLDADRKVWQEYARCE